MDCSTKSPVWSSTQSGSRQEPDGNAAASEISNDIDGTKALMIVGNRSAGGVRRVAMWDRVDVMGRLVVGPGTDAFQVTPAGLRVTLGLDLQFVARKP